MANVLKFKESVFSERGSGVNKGTSAQNIHLATTRVALNLKAGARHPKNTAPHCSVNRTRTLDNSHKIQKC